MLFQEQTEVFGHGGERDVFVVGGETVISKVHREHAKAFGQNRTYWMPVAM